MTTYHHRRTVRPSLAAILSFLLNSATLALQWSGVLSLQHSGRTVSPFHHHHRRRVPRADAPIASLVDPCRVGFGMGFSAGSICTPTSLFGGYGVATNYTWREEQYEIDVTVPVPAGTRASDLTFKATPRAVDLRLSAVNGDGGEEDVLLLDGSRLLRGRVAVDGTYWALSDREDGSGGERGERLVTVTIEKMIREPSDQFEVVEFDWGGVYPDDKDEVLEKKYDEAEELDVKEYCKELGVDIDNINMSLVDKTMFSSGLNMTRSTMDELSKAGYVKEVTQQDFGKEFITDNEGNAVPFSPLGNNIGDDEIQEAMYNSDKGGAGAHVVDDTSAEQRAGGGLRDQLRDLVGDGGPTKPWQNSMPAEEARIDEDGTNVKFPHDGGAEVGDSSVELSLADSQDPPASTSFSNMETDPIKQLTVKRLKEILREQGLKVSGNKEELTNRLQAHIHSMMEESRDE